MVCDSCSDLELYTRYVITFLSGFLFCDMSSSKLKNSEVAGLFPYETEFILFSLLCQVEECHLPGLGVALTLDHTKNEASEDGVSDLVCFISGLLLGTNAKVRTWFGTFIRNGQQVRD